MRAQKTERLCDQKCTPDVGWRVSFRARIEFLPNTNRTCMRVRTYLLSAIRERTQILGRNFVDHAATVSKESVAMDAARWSDTYFQDIPNLATAKLSRFFLPGS